MSGYPSHVIFDFDGTLADSSAGIIDSFSHTLEELGLPASDDTLRALIGPPLWHSFRTLGVAESELDDAVSRYRSWYERIGLRQATLYPEVAETLTALSARGVRLGVATAKRVDFAQTMLTMMGVADLFDVVAGSHVGLVLNEKYEIIAEALAHWGVTGSPAMWMVGDRLYDVEAARLHGMGAVGVSWGFGSRDELLNAVAHVVIDSADALLNAALVPAT